MTFPKDASKEDMLQHIEELEDIVKSMAAVIDSLHWQNKMLKKEIKDIKDVQ